jgi:prevent-host-death family protein
MSLLDPSVESAVQISLTDAKGQLTAQVRRAEAGEEVVLTRHGRPVVRLAPVKAPVDREARRRLMEKVMKDAAGKASPGPNAARSQDFLYDDEGLPR